MVTVLAPLVVLAVTQIVDWEPSGRIADVAVDLLTFATCWLTGFAHRTGALRRIDRRVLYPAAAVLLVGGVGWALTHPADGGSLSLDDIPLAQALISFGFALVVMRAAPSLRWLDARPALNGAVTVLNSRAVTVYLWHNLAIAASFPLGDLLHVWVLGDRYDNVGYFAVAVPVIAIIVVSLGWVEDVAARRRPRLLPTGTAPARAARHSEPPAGRPAPFADEAGQETVPVPLGDLPARTVASVPATAADQTVAGRQEELDWPGRDAAREREDTTRVIADLARPAPVFVDATGRRHRRIRTGAYTAAGCACLVYAGLVIAALAGGAAGPRALLPLPGFGFHQQPAPAGPAAGRVGGATGKKAPVRPAGNAADVPAGARPPAAAVAPPAPGQSAPAGTVPTPPAGARPTPTRVLESAPAPSRPVVATTAPAPAPAPAQSTAPVASDSPHALPQTPNVATSPSGTSAGTAAAA